MISCSEFTGVPLITLLELAGADLKNGKFVLAEGADGSSMTRTIPMDLIKSGEVFVAYGQNGEMLRPEQGYPLRSFVLMATKRSTRFPSSTLSIPQQKRKKKQHVSKARIGVKLFGRTTPRVAKGANTVELLPHQSYWGVRFKKPPRKTTL
jgi:hypothetical protein